MTVLQPRSIPARMRVNNFSVQTHLGCTEKERADTQEVLLSAYMQFKEPLLGEKTDDLKQTVCYAEICAELKSVAQNGEYQLVEKLARDCVQRLKQKYPTALVQMSAHKLHPPVQGLTGGVEYTCGDEFI